MQLGARLRSLRRERRYTLAEVSEKTGLSVSFLSDVERNRTRPSLETLERLAHFYQTNVNDILAEVVINQPASDINHPPGFADFLDEVKNEPGYDHDVVELMPKVEQRSRRRATTKEDWKQIYYSLKRILGR